MLRFLAKELVLKLRKCFKVSIFFLSLLTFILNKLLGPDPHTAVRLIDELGLYNMIFTPFIEPEQTFIELADTENWHVAYNQLSEITQACGEGTNHCKSLNTIAKILLRDSEDLYIAWTLTCFIPWARATLTLGEKPKSKTLFSPAAVAAREGLKADNKITKIIDGAVANLDGIEKMRELIIDEIDLAKSTLKRKDPSTTRETQGKAIRRWGSSWRSCVMYAILVHVTEAKDRVGMLKSHSHPEQTCPQSF